jgi:chromosomal replication initiator protein
VAILQKKSRIRGLSLPEDVINYIAAKIDANTRELEGAVTKIQGLASLQEGRIDVELAKAALGDIVAPDQRRISIQQILDAVTAYYAVKATDLQGKKRHKSIAFPRQVCMFLARRHTRFSLEEIGAHFGGRDHSTVIHAVRTIDNACTSKKDIATQIQEIDGQLQIG